MAILLYFYTLSSRKMSWGGAGWGENSNCSLDGHIVPYYCTQYFLKSHVGGGFDICILNEATNGIGHFIICFTLKYRRG